ncbi:TPA: hypothetical protein DF272_03940 [Candidatus Falkowbacteria bacterium]|nr:hypothetical protein [Candidatus Falkowbacteria bacterium]
MKEKNKIGCAVIGLGWWGQQMIQKIKKTNKFNILTVFDSDKNKTHSTAMKLNCLGVDDFQKILVNSQIKVVFIFSPNQYHKEQIVAAAKAGKKIFVEKPLANTSSECAEILKACRKNKTLLAVGHNVRRYSIFRKAKKMVNSGVLGDLILIDGNRSRPIGYRIDKNNWRYYRTSCNGGPLIQMGIHIIDTIRFVCGFEGKSFMTLCQKKFLTTENPETFSSIFELDNGCLVHLVSSYVLQETFYINFFGTKGSLFVDPFNGLFIQKHSGLNRKEIDYVAEDAENKELNDFYWAIMKGKKFEPEAYEAMQNVKIVENIIKQIKDY